MRFSVAVALSTLATLGAATNGGHKPTKTITVTVAGPTTTTVSQCNTGPIQCCNSVVPATDPSAAKLLGLLGVVVQGINVAVGLTCTPISVVGIGSGSGCSAKPVCCQNNDFKGLVAIGCVPISL